MSDQGGPCDRVECSIIFTDPETSKKTQFALWVPQEKPICDFVAQALKEVKRESGLYQLVWICEPENKVLRDDMPSTLESIGIKNSSQNQFRVSLIQACVSTPSEDDPEPSSEFIMADDELALGASASQTNLSGVPSPLTPRMTLDLNKTDKMEDVSQPYKSEPSESVPADDELGLGASASPTNNSSVPTPPPQPALFTDFENNKENSSLHNSQSSLQRRWQVDSTPSTSTSRRTGYVGLVNQAMTCYLNSLLQALFMTPEFRNALYSWEYCASSKKSDGSKSIPYQLQKLFLNLQTSSKSAVETTELTQSFGWDSSEAWQQHDIQELCRVMFDALEQKFKGTEQANLINKLYQGKMIDYVKCLECGKEKQREDTFLDIPLSIRPFGTTSAYSSVEEALRGFVKPETLDGNNQYFCEGCGKKCDAHKGLKFTHFPYLLTFHLMRFDFDYKTMHRIKLNDRVTFPEVLNLDHFFEDSTINEKETLASAEKNDDNSTADSGSALDDDSCLPSVESTLPTPSQEMDQDSDEGIEVGCASNGGAKDVTGRYVYELFSIMIHSGSASGGHYYAYIKDFSSQKWFCFNDQSVSSLMPEDIEKTFGGGSTHAYYSGAYSSSTNAYMLMYRQIDKEKNTFAMTIDEFPPHLKKLYEKLEEKERNPDPYAEMDYRFSTRCKVMEDSKPEKFTYDSQMESVNSEPQAVEQNSTCGGGDNPGLIEHRNKRRVMGKKYRDYSKSSDLPEEPRDAKEPIQICFFYPKNKDEFCHNPYAANLWKADLTYEASAPFSKLIDEIHQILLKEDPDIDRSQLILYFKKSSDKLDCLIEGAEDESIATVLEKHGPLKKMFPVTARTPTSKFNSVLCLPGSEKLTVHRIDIIEEEMSKGRVLCCPLSQTVEQFKSSLRAEFEVPESVKLLVAMDITNSKRTDSDRRSVHLDLQSTRLKFLVNDKATLKQEEVSCANLVYVCFVFDGTKDCIIMERMLNAIDSEKNSVTVNFTLPDVDPVILDRLSIPSLEEERKTGVNQKDSKVNENTQPVRETSKSSDIHRLRKHLDRDSIFISPKGDSCPVTIGGDAGGGGLVDPGGHAMTCSGDAPVAKPVCSIPILENIEEEQVHFSDQSASEESSLTDSERTIMGDVPDDCPMSSGSNSPDASFQLSQDLMYTPTNPQLSETKEDSSESNPVILSSKDCLVTSYRCKCLSSKNRSKQLSVDKRMPFKVLLENLEPFVGVSSQYFKIYSSTKSYEIRDEFEFIRYFQTENLFVIRLEPHLKHNETKVKIYFLPAMIAPNSEIEFLFEWIIRKGESVAETKQAMLKEYARIKHIDTPLETLTAKTRLRKKTTELSRICLDNEIWDEDIQMLKKGETFILQELSDVEIKQNPDQIAIYVRRWYPSKQAQGEIFEIVLDEDATRTMLLKEIEKVSGIPAEHIDVTRSPFLFPQSLYGCQPNEVVPGENIFGDEPEWNDAEENLKESSLRIGGDGAILLFIDKREEASKSTERFSNFNCSEHISVPLVFNRSQRYGNNQEQTNAKDMLESLNNSQKVKRRVVSRKEKGLKIHLGSSPVNSTLNCEMEE